MNWITGDPVGRTTPVGRGRLVEKWRGLAAGGAELSWNQRQLERTARQVIDGSGAECATRVYRTISAAQFLWFVRELDKGGRSPSEVVADISKLQKLLEKAARLGHRLQSEAARHNVRSQGTWISAVLDSLANDPLFQLHRFTAGKHGNPINIWTDRLFKALRAEGLTHNTIATIFRAIQRPLPRKSSKKK